LYSKEGKYVTDLRYLRKTHNNGKQGKPCQKSYPAHLEAQFSEDKNDNKRYYHDYEDLYPLSEKRCGYQESITPTRRAGSYLKGKFLTVPGRAHFKVFYTRFEGKIPAIILDFPVGMIMAKVGQ